MHSNQTKKEIKKKCSGLLLLLLLLSCFIQVRAQNLNNPNKVGPLGTQVNTLSGNLFIPRTDIYVPARMFDLGIRFYYNSFLFTEQYGYGKGWTFEYNIKYSTDTVPGGRLILWGDGREDKYDSLPGGGYKTPKGFFSKLIQYQPNQYVLTALDSVKYFFNNPVHKRITRMEEPNGNFINFMYSDTLLTAVNNAAGQSISFTYNPQGRLSTVVDAIASPSRTFTYTYDAVGNLTEVKDPLNGKYKYSYLVNGPMKSLTDKNNNKVDIIYFPDLTTSELIGCNKRLSFSYDTASQQTIVTDHLAAGNQVTKYTYQTVDKLSWITSMSGNCCGYNMSYEYDGQGNQTKMTDANGQVYKYTYDARGNMLTATDPLNQTSTYTYTTNFNKISTFKDAKGNLYSISYDGKGNLTQLIIPGNNIYTATYNTNGDIISSSDPKGNAYGYNYDVYGNPTTVTGPNGYNAILSFDARGNLLAFTDARGNYSTAEYDILDRLKKITDPINNSIQFTYDAAGNAVSFKNKNNETSIINYDASNRIVKATGPTGNQVNLSYDGMDNLTSVKNALGYESKLSYDNRNRVKASKDPDNNNAAYTYDGNGNITAVNLSNGQSLIYTYDPMNRLTAVKDASSTIAALTYDPNGNVTSYTNATGAIVAATYDSLDRIKKITDPLGNSKQFTYDKNNNILSVTDREGRVSFYSYDSLNRVKTYTDNNGFVITTGYDAQSNLTSLKDQNNNTTTYTYDSLNRRKRMTFPNGKYQEYSYDKKSNVTAVRLTDATIISYQYDTLNRVTSRTLPGGEVFSYTYDKLNRVLTASNNNGTVTFTYDRLNRVTAENFDGRTTRYNYNVSGRTQTTIYPDSSTVVKEFDTRNRLTKILKDSVTVVGYAYNNANQLTNKTFANGINSTMQYDFANRLSSISTLNGTIQNTTFSYDKEMNKTAITRLNNPALSEQFTYDNGYRLTNYKRGPAGSPVIQNTYTYDAVGNRTAANLNGIPTTYTINNLNQLTAVNSTSFVFDDRGNITFDGTFYKTYDAENRLKKDSASPASVINYGYDAFNRRTTKIINGSTLKYTYSGAAQIEERNGSNALLNRTVFSNFLSPVLNEKNGNKFYYHPNELGSVEAISNSSGRLIESYQYDAYGKLSRYDSLNSPLNSSIAGNRFGFTGQEYDSASGSYRFFFRNYSPATGTFNQRDLIEYQDGMGMYQYVGNNPANGVDVWGLECSSPKNGNSKEEDRSKEVVKVFGEVKKVKDYVSKAEKVSEITDFKNVKFGLSGFSLAIDIVLAPAEIAAVAIKADDYIQGYDKRTDVQNFEKGTELGADGTAATAGFIKAVSKLPMGVGKVLVGTTTAGVAAAVGEAYVGYQVLDNVSQQIFNNFLDPGASVESAAKLKAKLRRVDKSIQKLENQSQVRFDRHHKQLEYITNKFGADQSNWTQEWIDMYETHQDAIEVGFSYSGPQGTSCSPSGGTRKLPLNPLSGVSAAMFIFLPIDPNLIIGPDGQPNKKWVSVKDRMPYTILFENDSTATARTRYIKITTPVEPKQDAATVELASFGFNNQSFTIPTGTSSYYNRLDCRDSTGLYVDITAGYDVVGNKVFWEFQGIDPITLLPPEDPLAGFLFLQDSTQPDYGNGFVNFSMKPLSSAQTLDTIGARAVIVFDENEAIPTNIHSNTIDAFAPTSHMNTIAATTNPITLSWTGADDSNGCGIDYYTIYVSTDQVNYSVLIPRIRRTDTTLTLPPDTSYCFFVLATDRVGNKETLRLGEIKCTYIGPTLPVTWLYFRGKTVAKNNILDWATATEQNSKQFDVERSLSGISASFGKIGFVNAAGNSTQTRTYQYTDRDIDKLNSGDMFYRLKQIDIDGKFKYSNIVRLQYNKNNTTQSIIYPNPTPGLVTILVGDNALIGTAALIYDINGRLMESIKITSGSQQVNLSRYVNGVYFIKLNNKEAFKVIKQ